MNPEDLVVGKTYYRYLGQGLGIQKVVYNGRDAHLFEFVTNDAHNPVYIHKKWMKSIFENEDLALISSLKYSEAFMLHDIEKAEKKLRSSQEKLEETRRKMKSLREKYPEEFV